MLAEDIRTELAGIEEGARTALSHAIVAGELLAVAKGRLAHGEWLPWLEKNFALTPRVAQQYMLLASNTKRVSHLGSIREALATISEPKGGGSKPGKQRPWKDPAILDWVAERRAAKWNSKRIVTASREKTNGYPGTRALSDGSLVTVFAVLDDRNGRPDQPKTKSKIHGKRMHAAKLQLKREPKSFHEIRWELTRLIYSVDAANYRGVDMDVDADDLDMLLADLLYLEEVQADLLAQVQARLGDHGLRKTLANMRKRTVANGCTPEEEAAALRHIPRLEKKLALRLESLT